MYKSKDTLVYHVTPGRGDKDIGKAYNDLINCLPDEAWIALRDGDTIFLTPDWPKIVEGIASEAGNFKLIGAMTNRIGGNHQLHDGRFSNYHDISYHKKIAHDRFDEHGFGVEPTSGVAGFFMLFSKATWSAVGGFKERDIHADTLFNKSVRQKFGKASIGLATGLYIYHMYRIWEDDHYLARHKAFGHLRR